MKVYFVKLQNDYWSNMQSLDCWNLSAFREDALPFSFRKHAEAALKIAVENQIWRGSSMRSLEYKKLTRADFKIVSLKGQSALKF